MDAHRQHMDVQVAQDRLAVDRGEQERTRLVDRGIVSTRQMRLARRARGRERGAC